MRVEVCDVVGVVDWDVVLVVDWLVVRDVERLVVGVVLVVNVVVPDVVTVETSQVFSPRRCESIIRLSRAATLPHALSARTKSPM